MLRLSERASERPAVLLIVGTGVAGHRLYTNGWSIQRDAWGWIAGDRGGGNWIGRKALRHCFAAIDGVVPQDALSREILRAIGGVEKLRVGWMRDLGPARLAALAPLVLEQADAGDQTARRIRDRAVEHLAALILVIAARTRHFSRRADWPRPFACHFPTKRTAPFSSRTATR